MRLQFNEKKTAQGACESVYTCINTCASPWYCYCSSNRVGEHRDRGINQITGVMRWRGGQKKKKGYVYSRIITLENETVFFSFFSTFYACFLLSVATKISRLPYGWLFVQQAEHTRAASGHTRQREILKPSRWWDAWVDRILHDDSLRVCLPRCISSYISLHNSIRFPAPSSEQFHKVAPVSELVPPPSRVCARTFILNA